MRRETYGFIISGIIIAVVSVVMGYFFEPLMAVLGLLIAASYVTVAVAQHHSSAVSDNEKKLMKDTAYVPKTEQ